MLTSQSVIPYRNNFHMGWFSWIIKQINDSLIVLTQSGISLIDCPLCNDVWQTMSWSDWQWLNDWIHQEMEASNPAVARQAHSGHQRFLSKYCVGPSWHVIKLRDAAEINKTLLDASTEVEQKLDASVASLIISMICVFYFFYKHFSLHKISGYTLDK